MNYIYSIIFYLVAGVCILGALGVIFAPRVIYSAVFLVLTFLSVAGIFILASADFVGLAQILIYGVGITILIVFALMLTSEKEDKKLWLSFSPKALLGLIFSGVLFFVLTFSFTNGYGLLKKYDQPFKKQTFISSTTKKTLAEKGTTEIIGKGLLRKYVLPFEMVSVLLLVVILGAVVLASKDDERLLNPTTTKEEEC